MATPVFLRLSLLFIFLFLMILQICKLKTSQQARGNKKTKCGGGLAQWRPHKVGIGSRVREQEVCRVGVVTY